MKKILLKIKVIILPFLLIVSCAVTPLPPTPNPAPPVPIPVPTPTPEPVAYDTIRKDTTIYNITHKDTTVYTTVLIPDTIAGTATMATIRFVNPTADGQLVVLNAGDQSGVFKYVASDVSDIDDSVMIFVTTSGARLQRVVTDAVYCKWFGTHVNTSEDSWQPMQKAIDFILNHPGEYSQILKTGNGYFHFSRGLFLGRWLNTQYVFSSIRIIGESNYSEADGYGTTFFFDFDNGPGIVFQLAKGSSIEGIKLVGQWSLISPTPEYLYFTPLSQYTDGHSRNSFYSPNAAIVVDAFSGSVPPDGGYPGWTSYYRGTTGVAGSTGVEILNMFLSAWNVGVITSPNGRTANAEMLTIRDIHVENMRLAFAGCQDQEKLNSITNVQAWGLGAIHTVFATNQYGAASVGSWDIDLVNCAGMVNQLVYNNQGGYFQSTFNRIYAESLGRIGYITSTNGTKITNSQINFAVPLETGGHIITDQISGYGVTYDGDQLRNYGAPTIPVQIATGSSANDNHFIHCSFENGVPFYPQNYPYGYSDFFNCWVGAQSSASRLNPMGPSGNIPQMYAYPTTSTLAAKLVSLDFLMHQLNTSTVITDSMVTKDQVIYGTYDYITYKAVGMVSTITANGFTLYNQPMDNDTTKQYSLYLWKTPLKTMSIKKPLVKKFHYH